MLRVGKSQDTYLGNTGKRRILKNPVGTGDGASPCVKFKVHGGGVCGCELKKGKTRKSGRFWLLLLVRRSGGVRRSLCPLVSALGQLPLSNPCRHMDNGVMKQRSED